MANFDEAYLRTLKFEGGYANVDGDSGEETYKGISRAANPNWEGWKIVDEYRTKSNFPKNLDGNQELQKLVRKCYKDNYWDKVWGDRIKHQKVANDLYDVAVNCGPAMSIKLSERQFKMKETGKMSEQLLSRLNSVV